MNLFKSVPIFKKHLWRIIRVSVLMDSDQVNTYAFNTATDLLDKKLVSKVYFARYGTPRAGTTYVDFKLVPSVPDAELEAYLFTRGPEIHTIETMPFEGSDAHAQAFLLAQQLRGSGDDNIAVVLHWLLNMTGFSYTDEVKLHAKAAYTIADGLNRIERGE